MKPSPPKLVPVLLLDVTGDCAGELAASLQGRGWAVHAFGDTEAALAASPDLQPQAIIVSIDQALTADAACGLLGEFTSVLGYRPRFVFLTARDDRDTAVQAALHGVDAYFTRPVNLHSLSAALNAMLDTEGRHQFRTLIASADEEWSRRFGALLEAHDVHVERISTIDQLQVMLTDFRPELILVDTELPWASCITMCRLVRIDETYFITPVFFLSDDDDPGKQTEALSAGVNDVVSRSQPAQIAMMLVRRAQRYRRLFNMILYDPLTGTVSREAFLERAEEELEAMKRHGGQACLAMIDVDKFKEINDTYGHIAGDAALRYVAQALRTRLRRTDMIGRYAGDEFIVLLPDTGGENGLRVLDQIRGALATSPLQLGGDMIDITLSIGVTSIEPDEELAVNKVIASADALLYEAKQGGRNQVVRQ